MFYWQFNRAWCTKEVQRLVRVAGRGYSDGARNLEVMLESLSGGRRQEIQEDGIVMEVKKIYLPVPLPLPLLQCFQLLFNQPIFRISRQIRLLSRSSAVGNDREKFLPNVLCNIRCNINITYNQRTTYVRSNNSSALCCSCSVLWSRNSVSEMTSLQLFWQTQVNGSVKEPNKFNIYESEKITRKASNAAEYIKLFSSFTRDRHA